MALPNNPEHYDAEYFKSKYLSSPFRYMFYASVILQLGFNSVLDVGCGPGTLVNYLNALGVNAVGADFSVDSGADVIARCDNLPFNEGEFDLVISTDLLEHLEEDVIDRSISEFSRVGKRQAHFICFEEAHHPDDDPYHITLRPRVWWLNKFSLHGLFPSYEFCAFGNNRVIPQKILIPSLLNPGVGLMYLMVF